jgi:hypothetical protein
MQPPTTINPDVICNQAIQAKLNIYQAKEHFDSVLKLYNDQVDNLINLVNLMKGRIIELESEIENVKNRNENS